MVRFNQIFQHKLTANVNFYRCHCMVGTSFLVAHHNRVYIYHIGKHTKMVNSYQCPDKVVKFFRIEKEKGVYEIAVIL